METFHAGPLFFFWQTRPMAKKTKRQLSNEQARIDTMCDAVDVMQRTHDAWQSDGSKNPRPSEGVMAAINNCIGVILRGGESYPKTATLTQAVLQFEAEVKSYLDGNYQRITGAPKPTFWNAYLKVVECRHGMAEPEYKPPEPILRMHECGATHNEIAKEYGWRDADGNWCGPFFGENHEPLPHLIAQQIAHEKGEKDTPAVIDPEWKHPGRMAVYHAELADAERQLSEVREALEADKPYTEAGTISELLLEGQFVDKIARLKGVSEDEVHAVAGAMNLVPNQMGDSRPWAEQLAAQRERIVEPEADEPPPAAEPMAADKLREAVLTIRKADTEGVMDAAAIARQLSEQFEMSVKVQDVARVLKDAKSPAA